MQHAARAAFLVVVVTGCAQHRPESGTAGAGSAASLSPVAPLASQSASPLASLPSLASSAPSRPAAAVADASPPPPDVARVHARVRSVPIHPDATLRGKPIGTLAAGDAVDLRDEPARTAPGCPSVRAVAPRGWVCVDGEAATLDEADAVWLALRAHTPDGSSAWPYSYGESRGARRHRTLTDVAAPSWPPALLDPHATIAARSTVAWTDEVEAEGTSWLRTSDMSFVRKDRVVPFDRVPFQGVALGADVKLPIAFFKRGAHARYRRDADGRLVVSGDPWPRLEHVELTGKTEKRSHVVFWETREDGVWIDARDAAIVAPDGAPPDGPHPTWIEVAALQGWLVAYEEDTPVFATMISAGKLGAARPDPDHEPHQPAATTPLGTFRVREKLRTATLQSDLDDGTEFVHAEVPWSQRFYDKYLLHTAYWHDAWGEGHSGGCVNLSPVDAKWLFSWTDPKLPEGWHSVRAQDGDEKPATIVVIHP
jgi:lipoprotein-anchoring transpeptidase ErfK/SrfK